MKVRSVVPAVVALGTFVAGGLPGATIRADVVQMGTSYVWVGSGDGTSWSDAANWQPRGVPGAADSATLDSALDTCSIAVTAIPDGSAVADLNLMADSGCPLQVSGGSLAVTGSLDWAAGTLGLPLTIPSAATAELTGDGAVARDLEGSMDVAGSLVLDAATIAGAGTITVRAGGVLVGGGAIDGRVDNEAGMVSDAAGRTALTLRIGSFTQGEAGRLQVLVAYELVARVVS